MSTFTTQSSASPLSSFLSPLSLNDRNNAMPARSPSQHSNSSQNTIERRESMLRHLRGKFSKNKASRDMSANAHPSPYAPMPTRRPNPPASKPNEPPPAYTANDPQAASTLPIASSMNTPSASASASTSSPNPSQTSDTQYAFLETFDTVFLIDDSGSMAGRSWRETRQALETITPICTSHDADGIDIYFLNHPDRPAIFHNVKVASTVAEIFSTVRPGGATPTGQSLNRILKPYLRRCEANLDNTKPLNIIVITDGAPTDDVESVIISAAKKLDKLDAPAWQVGIQFFQVGNEPEAREHLKQLDDELGDIAGDDDLRDMVDTVPFKGAEGSELNADGVLKVVLGSVLRRLDRKRSKDLHR